jgi:hypothetical protein
MVRKPAYALMLKGMAPEIDNVPSFKAALAEVSQMGNVWYVDSVNGSDTDNDGTTLDQAYATIATAVAAAAANDTIYIRGSFSEAVTVSVEGLKIIGLGTAPKQAQWTAAADAVCLTIAAAYVHVENIYFRPPAYAASRATSAITLSSAHHARIIGNRFQGKAGSQAAIYSPVCNSDNVYIVGNEFFYLNTATYGAGILGVEAGGLSYSGWMIADNVFQSCVTAININGRCCNVLRNIIAEAGIAATGAGGTVLALGIDLSGTSSYGNQVHGNYLGGTYNATLYKIGAAGDDWGGNFNIAGVTAANPA